MDTTPGQDLKQKILKSVMDREGIDPVVTKFLLKLEEALMSLDDRISRLESGVRERREGE